MAHLIFSVTFNKSISEGCTQGTGHTQRTLQQLTPHCVSYIPHPEYLTLGTAPLAGCLQVTVCDQRRLGLAAGTVAGRGGGACGGGARSLAALRIVGRPSEWSSGVGRV